MAVTVEREGVDALLSLLEVASRSHALSEADVHRCILLNSYFIEFYCGWEGVTVEGLSQILRDLAGPARFEPNSVLAKLRAGFMEAIPKLGALRNRASSLQQMDFTAIENRVRRYLPEGTPIDSAIHLTIDEFNGAFQHAGEMGISLSRPFSDPAAFTDVLSHELHHLGFRYWATRDSRRQLLLSEDSARSVAVGFVENLLFEGMAVKFFTSNQFSPDATGLVPEEPSTEYRLKVEGFRRNENTLFKHAEALLRDCLTDSADLEHCRRSAQGFLVDLQGVQPSGHYLGWRMVDTMSTEQENASIVDNIRDLSHFLEQYNHAAEIQGTYHFGDDVVRLFSSAWIDLPEQDNISRETISE